MKYASCSERIATPVAATASSIAQAGESHPHLRVIVAHCGGALPALAWRIAHLAEIGRGRDDADLTPKSVDRALRGLYYDTALSGARGPIAARLAH